MLNFLRIKLGYDERLTDPFFCVIIKLSAKSFSYVWHVTMGAIRLRHGYGSFLVHAEYVALLVKICCKFINANDNNFAGELEGAIAA